MSNQDLLVLHEQELSKIEEALRSLFAESQAACALLISCRDGSLIWRQGDTANLDVDSLAALAAAGFSATKEIARLIGEPEFNTLFHQGEQKHIHMNLVGEEALLIVVFSDSTSIGLVRLLSKDCSTHLANILSGTVESNA